MGEKSMGKDFGAELAAFEDAWCDRRRYEYASFGEKLEKQTKRFNINTAE